MTGSVIVMGVAGSGKSTVGAALADRLHRPFIEGDDHHPPANVAKMASGTALSDDDRAPWLDALNGLLMEAEASGTGSVLACSALTGAHRRRLADGLDDPLFVHLVVDAETVRRRLRGRRGHFMGASMVDGQFAALEEPSADDAVLMDATAPVADIVAHLLVHLRA